MFLGQLDRSKHISAMKSVTLRVPCFTPAQALFFAHPGLAHPTRPGCCALIGTDVPLYGAPSWNVPFYGANRCPGVAVECACAGVECCSACAAPTGSFG